MAYFPKDFLWGVACASYQCEGGWDADGKGRNIWDDFCREPGKVKYGDTGDTACDTYHRIDEDVALMKKFGVQAYRFSLSWARILPEGDGEVNEAGLEYYSRVVDLLLENGIEPMVTLYHWDLPSALQYKGGWLNRDIVKAFGRYADIVSKRFGDRVTRYMTINEPQCITALGYGKGVLAPGWVLPDVDLARIYHNIALSHSEAQRRIRGNVPGAQVGIVPCGQLCYPKEETEENIEAAYRASFDLSHGWWAFKFNICLDNLIRRGWDDTAPETLRRFQDTVPASDWQLMETPDFLGMNVYNGDCVDGSGRNVPQPSGHPVTGCKWPVTPEVLHYGPIHLYRRYQLPLYITENGLSCNDVVSLDGLVHDPARIDFLHRYLRELSKALQAGIPLRGYLHWSFLDNFEWASGYDERFGLIHVDYQTLVRTPKDSAAWYRRVIETNGAEL
ncbi:MAG: beta-glucosidase [Clostridia bacterium]|nr:beta-glucosidase [Clostridia bacterium]